jgi:hypothetical protein
MALKYRYTYRLGDDGALLRMPIVRVLFTNPKNKKQVEVGCLIDSGADDIFLNTRLADALGVDITKGAKKVPGNYERSRYSQRATSFHEDRTRCAPVRQDKRGKFQSRGISLGSGPVIGNTQHRGSGSQRSGPIASSPWSYLLAPLSGQEHGEGWSS